MVLNGNGKKLHPGWISLIVYIIVQMMIISGFAWTNNTKTNRNEKDIQMIMEDQKKIVENIYKELTTIRKEINK